MLNGILAKLAGWTIGRKLLGGLAFVHDKLDGKKSEILLGLLAAVHALKLVGIIAPEQAAQIEVVLGSILPVALADRASKIINIADKIVPELPKPPAP